MTDLHGYWARRAPSYGDVNRDELRGIQHELWAACLMDHFPEEAPSEVKVLDIGTGPGFFACILAEEGYDVTALDYTEEMLAEAKANAELTRPGLSKKIRFVCADCSDLPFFRETFDVIVTRNLTWNLSDPAGCYREWMRVLKEDGVLLNFDANWYRYLADDKERELYERDRAAVAEAGVFDQYLGTDIDAMEALARKMPLTPVMRPAWDVEILTELGFSEVEAEEDMGDLVYSEEEKINYKATPLFMVRAVK